MESFITIIHFGIWIVFDKDVTQVVLRKALSKLSFIKNIKMLNS